MLPDAHNALRARTQRAESMRQKELHDRRSELNSARMSRSAGELQISTWKDGTGELQRKLMLESAQASQRHEEAVRRDKIAAKERREAGLREIEREWQVKVEQQKRAAAAWQEKEGLRWQRELEQRKLDARKSGNDDKRAVRASLDRMADQQKSDLQSAIAARRKKEEEDRKRAEQKEKERLANKSAVCGTLYIAPHDPIPSTNRLPC